MSQIGDRVQFARDCDVVQIPAGHRLTLPRGTEAVLQQALGGTFTLQVPKLGALVRLAGRDADAIGLPVEEPKPAGPSPHAGDLERRVWETLKSCYDPEIPVNIVDLGLVYDLRIAARPDGGGSAVSVKMTLTAQGCGMGGTIAADAQQKIETLPGVDEARVEIVWDPPWSPQMISPEGREKLGIG
ncbi:MAG: iron-sulfur cluster assembly protein [Candidatus Binatia bacterium]